MSMAPARLFWLRKCCVGTWRDQSQNPLDRYGPHILAAVDNIRIALQVFPPESLFTINVGRSRSVARFSVDVRTLCACCLPHAIG